MKLNTLEKIYIALLHEQPELLMSDDMIEKAKKPILKMLELSAKFGL
jgi:quinolinate synthase